MKKLGLLYLIATFLFCSLSYAQVPTSVDILGDNMSYKEISRKLNKIGTDIKNGKIVSDDIGEYISYINDIWLKEEVCGRTRKAQVFLFISNSCITRCNLNE